MTTMPGDGAADRLSDVSAEGWVRIIAATAVLGVLADALFNGAALGINVPLWTGALIGTMAVVGRTRGKPIGLPAASLLAASLALSAMVAWRSAPLLQAVLIVAASVLLLLAVVVEHDARARRASLTLFFASLGLGMIAVGRGGVLLARSVPWRAALNRGGREQAQAAGRAALFATPLVLVFGALFFAADAVFASWIEDSLTFNAEGLARHLGWVFGGALVAGGVLWFGMTAEPAATLGPELATERRLRSLETGVVLGSLVALFALFVAIQIQYLFGGADRVQASTGLTFSEYARRGFFELVAVAALLLPVLLAADWARTRDRRSLTTFRLLGGLLVALLAVVMTSAFERLRIYVDAYGLTGLRFYAAALLAWLGAVFGWLVWALLRERRDQFVAGTVISALVALVVLVAVNPDGRIASTNLARAEQGRDFDAPYAVGLSADATPTLVDGVAALPAEEGCVVAGAMLARWGAAEEEWRSWNLGRWAAAQAVGAERAELVAAC